MIRVVKQGNLPENEIYSGLCRKCKSELEARKGELREKQTHIQSWDMFGICPVCHAQVKFNPKKEEKI